MRLLDVSGGPRHIADDHSMPARRYTSAWLRPIVRHIHQNSPYLPSSTHRRNYRFTGNQVTLSSTRLPNSDNMSEQTLLFAENSCPKQWSQIIAATLERDSEPSEQQMLHCTGRCAVEVVD
ncbi:hypothetical protein EVAR_88718_1 [Eumeta japonica]|uniref:Uncharacterized protein n=1 Tax=Eumeta variegata TaxID=151549 RepID=A0A4C1XHY5_EUMVA|nr:hypothetical protein EVAR_88718_1 [Eumeta japonica]